VRRLRRFIDLKTMGGVNELTPTTKAGALGLSFVTSAPVSFSTEVENVLKTLGDIGNRWLPQTTCALCQIFRRPPAAVATSRADYRK
jgi:hypothetical protein